MRWYRTVLCNHSKQNVDSQIRVHADNIVFDYFNTRNHSNNSRKPVHITNDGSNTRICSTIEKPAHNLSLNNSNSRTSFYC